MYVYHYSEESAIPRFEPRPAPAYPELGQVVWAVNEERAPNYYLPRDCPRIIARRGAPVSAELEEKLFGYSTADTIMFVEGRWLGRIRNAKLFCYTLPADTFVMIDGTAGYHVSEQGVTPLTVEPMGDLLARIVEKGIELRVVPNLFPLRDAVPKATMDYSMIRFRNAMDEG
ncbi:hypothetical protein K0T92_05770 [Paenibacillus oenotherae]|uniref:Uncharacterized protein n=1 Tax=Paenibacillus oenotherae TaxID=1435645 RepID=A0ABS7D2S8_9BACL|nr:DUF6886 family protein [Paenibacillus oenotherae]MBW7474244.1 hypothetical protein [Paenibacillus oenotherae]